MWGGKTNCYPIWRVKEYMSIMNALFDVSKYRLYPKFRGRDPHFDWRPFMRRVLWEGIPFSFEQFLFRYEVLYAKWCYHYHNCSYIHLCSLLRSRSALQITMKSSSLSSFNYIMFFFFFFLCQYFAVPVSALCPTRPNWIRRCMHPREYRGKGDAPSSLTSNLYWSSL